MSIFDGRLTRRTVLVRVSQAAVALVAAREDAHFRLGQRRIDFKKVRQALDKIDYGGWIHLEAAVPQGAAKDYAADYQYLRGIFPKLAA